MSPHLEQSMKQNAPANKFAVAARQQARNFQSRDATGLEYTYPLHQRDPGRCADFLVLFLGSHKWRERLGRVQIAKVGTRVASEWTIIDRPSKLEDIHTSWESLSCMVPLIDSSVDTLYI